MSRIITIGCIFSLLWSLIFLNFTNAQEEILECMIRDGHNAIHLKLRKTEQWLANENLPIWTANLRKEDSEQPGSVNHERKLHFMKNYIGSFIFYHDKEKSAAVVYLRVTGNLIGIVDTRYMIMSLPLRECNLGHYTGGKYVKRLEWIGDTNLHYHLKPLDLSMRGGGQSTASDWDGPSTFVSAEDKQQITLYPEIMLFVPYPITKMAKSTHTHNYLTVMVLHYIVYFNAVDMLVSKLSTHDIKIHLNLAGIVIEEQENAFSFITPFNGNSAGILHPNVHHIDAVRTLQSFVHYRAQNHHIFPQDSFDFFFITTNEAMWSTALNKETAGLSLGIDEYERRRHRIDNYSMGGIVQNKYGYEYITAGHEIAHLMSINHDPLNKGYRNGHMQCYAVMQEVNNFCPDCLKWSDESIEDLKKYVKYNRNRCYILNRPRSLLPYGIRMRTLSAADQCYCYGFEPQISNYLFDYLKVIPAEYCRENLICGTSSDDGRLPSPVDGTPCTNNRVCWNQLCEPIQTYSEY